MRSQPHKVCGRSVPGRRGSRSKGCVDSMCFSTFVRKEGGWVPGWEERVVDRAGAQVEGGSARSGPSGA